MYEIKTENVSDFKIFGIKIFERIWEKFETLEREFLEGEDEQNILASKTIITLKIFGIPMVKMSGNTIFDTKVDNTETKKKEPVKIKSPNIKNSLKTVLTVLCLVLGLLSTFLAGFYVSNYINSHKYDNLNNLVITSPKPNKSDYYTNDMSQYELNMSSEKMYNDYHKYFEKVVSKIKKYDFEEPERQAINNYLDGYNERKEKMIDTLFPRNNIIDEYGYGTIYGFLYSSAMTEFDRLELTTYKMILENMYYSFDSETIHEIFEN